MLLTLIQVKNYLIKIKRSQLSLDNEKIGAKFFEFLKSNSIIELSFFNNNIKDFSLKNKNFLDEFIHGAQLKSYTFKKYKSDKKKEFFNFYISMDSKSIDFNMDKNFLH